MNKPENALRYAVRTEPHGIQGLHSRIRSTSDVFLFRIYSLQCFLRCRNNMFAEHSGGYRSYAARDRGDRADDRLDLFKVRVAAEFTFGIDIDAYIDDRLARGYKGIIYDTCASDRHDQ